MSTVVALTHKVVDVRYYDGYRRQRDPRDNYILVPVQADMMGDVALAPWAGSQLMHLVELDISSPKPEKFKMSHKVTLHTLGTTTSSHDRQDIVFTSDRFHPSFLSSRNYGWNRNSASVSTLSFYLGLGPDARLETKRPGAWFTLVLHMTSQERVCFLRPQALYHKGTGEVTVPPPQVELQVILTMPCGGLPSHDKSLQQCDFTYGLSDVTIFNTYMSPQLGLELIQTNLPQPHQWLVRLVPISDDTESYTVIYGNLWNTSGGTWENICQKGQVTVLLAGLNGPLDLTKTLVGPDPLNYDTGYQGISESGKELPGFRYEGEYECVNPGIYTWNYFYTHLKTCAEGTFGSDLMGLIRRTVHEMSRDDLIKELEL